MNQLMRWNPFKEMDELQERLATLFGRLPPHRDQEERLTIVQWAPRVDIIEDDKEYLIKAELPEVRKEDVKVSVEDGVLTISGERKHEAEENGAKYHRVERAYGLFSRSFTVPESADASKVSAEFKNGVLTVHLPKDEKAKPKSIEVKVV